MLNVSPGQLSTIKQILAQYLSGCEVRAFGSRVNGSADSHSDIDLAVIAPGKMKLTTKTLLNEAFEESDLPFRVDIIDYNAVSDEFRAIINTKYEILQKNNEATI